ncbi:protein FLX-like 2 [Gastrolobium bilobum]|uniref:protein FLX-like 2 n=1 Tax=Gastrolobium bilobum TaxID=150636 RepID=UPI002AB1E2D4|nr:protein FLX-like 2 [Gastrolobium bilobum]
MGSKGRMPPPPPHLRRQLPHPFDLLPPPPLHVMEQKLASQHVEMQGLATENQRLAATHGALRQELAVAQHELHMVHGNIGSVKEEREHQMRGLIDKIAKMEAEVVAAEPVRVELQEARGEAQKLVVSREELISKGQELSHELQRVHVDVQHIPALISELDCLRQEYQHCRATYDYEKKLYNDHLESLQVMEKNYVSMSREVEKLQAELTNTANVDRSSGPYGGTSGTNENEASGLPVGQNAYEDSYAVVQGRGPLPAASGGGSTTTATTVGAQPGPAFAGTGYDDPRGPGYNTSAGPTYDVERGVTYDTQRLTGYDAFRGSAYDSKRGSNFDAQRTGYDPQRGPGYDAQRGPSYDASRAAGYDPQSRGFVGPHGHTLPVNNMPYGSITPPASSGGYEAARGVNHARR